MENINERPNPFHAVVILAVFLLVILMIMLSPIFALTDIKIENPQGFAHTSQSEIADALGLSDSPNFFLITERRAKKVLLKNPYIKAIHVKKTLPNAVTVTVTERRVCGYIEDSGNYIYIDNEGRVLDVRTNVTESVPSVWGLKFSSYTRGELLNVPDKSTFKTVLQLSDLFEANELTEEVITVNVADSQNIQLHVYNINVNLGDIGNATDKLRYLRAILDNSKVDLKKARGTLDLRNVYKGEVARFEITK